MRLSDFDFPLPEELVAQQPLAQRSSSRLLHLTRSTHTVNHCLFDDLPNILQEGDLLVRNDTKVLPARLIGRRKSGGRVEVLLLRQRDAENTIWHCMTRSSNKLNIGTCLEFPSGISGKVVEIDQDGHRLIHFSSRTPFFEALERAGKMPLPPYIRRESVADDRDRYQTVYAEKPGAVAAPTAGLHFTETTFTTLKEQNIEVCGITLHVGAGTFLPVRTEDLREHRMHPELYEIPAETAERINTARREGRRIVALGTTVTRTLEAAVDDQGLLAASQGETDLFILPGHQFRAIDVLITNFHLPKSTLLVLVSAFAGTDFVKRAYRLAVENKYRFFSYGDCMIIE